MDRINKKFFLMAVAGQYIAKNTDLDIAVRCPICGDSHKKKNSARLHLYTKPDIDVDFVHCFNGDCPCKNKTVYSFLRDFFPNLLSDFKRENYSNTIESISNGDVFSNFKKESKTDEVKTDIVTQDLSPFFKPIEESEVALEYLQNRCYNYNKEDFGKWYFGYQDLQIGETLYKTSNSIVIPLYYKKEMYGFYSRNINQKIFYTYMHDANVGYKIFNWFNINKDEEVYIFEGIFDAISSGLKNIIALMGATIPDERLKELKKPIFVLDNDKTGILNCIKYANNGYKVFIQPNNFKEKDINELKLNNNNLNIGDLIKNNLYTGISAEVRLKSKL